MKMLSYKEHPLIATDVSPLYLNAFPPSERPPLNYFYYSLDSNDKNNLFAFYDSDEFIGFSYISIYQDIAYIFFLAIETNFRHQGYGSKIISKLKEEYKDYTLLLCYEEVDEKYPDYDNRKKREEFYMKNGFKKNPLKTDEFGVVFQTAVIGREVTFSEYLEIFKIGFGVASEKHIFEVK